MQDSGLGRGQCAPPVRDVVCVQWFSDEDRDSGCEIGVCQVQSRMVADRGVGGRSAAVIVPLRLVVGG
jgi:hypothetical protein